MKTTEDPLVLECALLGVYLVGRPPGEYVTRKYVEAHHRLTPRLGCETSRDPDRERAVVDVFLAPFASLPFDDASAERYSEVRHHLERAGVGIGAYDLQIAAIALSNGLTLVTHNTREFSRVPGLTWEDWEVPP